MSRWRSLLGGNREDAWREVARRRRGRYVKGGLLGQDAVQEETGDWTITLQLERSDDRRKTVLRAPFANPYGFRFTITRAGFFSGFLSRIGFEDVEVGHPHFDRDFVIKANDWARAEAFLREHRIRALLGRQKHVRFEVREGARWLGRGFQGGVDELRFEWPGVLTDVGRLCDLFQLLENSLYQLCYDGRSSSRTLEAHLQRLAAPSRRETDGPVVWDGARVRRLAAVALGELGDPRAVEALIGLLEDEDDELRSLSVASLTRLGDAAAIDPLVRLIGHRARTESDERLGDVAAEAVRALGAPETADALVAAISGEVDDLRTGLGPFRDEAVDALTRALGSGVTAGAALALQELDARESLPVLRATLRESSSEEARAVLERVIQELEARGSLPRSADGRVEGVPTLPKQASAPAAGPVDALPRPTGAADEETG